MAQSAITHAEELEVMVAGHGHARRAMLATIWAALVNAVLDPILIFSVWGST